MSAVGMTEADWASDAGTDKKAADALTAAFDAWLDPAKGRATKLASAGKCSKVSHVAFEGQTYREIWMDKKNPADRRKNTRIEIVVVSGQ